MARNERPSPADLSTSWPNQPSSDQAAETARRFALNLRDAIGKRSVRSVAAAAGISEGAIRHVLNGSVWPDLRTISRLETALETSLYPSAN
ncbi:multiprotein-bridging factor 1 family protein [Microbacterium sp. NPDC089696]|uniref:helix-turn-helix domain-containing protein n=1 Tax=Microbacterium sp. NPDC089696 TaxID=3364199 RepID=UPI003813FE12